MTDWREVVLEDLASDSPHALATGPFGSAISSKHFVDAGVPVIRGSNLSLDVGVRLSDDGLVFLGEELAERFRRSIARRGDLVFTCWGTVGQVGLIDERSRFDEYVVSNKQMKLTPDPERVDSHFLYYLLSSPDMVSAVTGQSIGAAVPGFNLGQLRLLTVILPGLKEQRSVASVLRSIDDLIENNRRRVAVLEEMARAIYREWFVQFRYPGHEDVPLVDSPLGPNPDGWAIRPLGEISVNHDRRRRPLSKAQRRERSGTVPYYGAAKLIDRIDGWIFDGEYLLFAEDGSVQTPDGFPVLQLVEGKFWANNHTHILEGSSVSTRFLYLASAVQPITGYVTGAAQPKITQANLNRIPLVVGPPELHQAFDAVVDSLFDDWRLLQVANASLAATRDLLLPRLVTGEIDVSEMDLDGLLEGAIG